MTGQRGIGRATNTETAEAEADVAIGRTIEEEEAIGWTGETTDVITIIRTKGAIPIEMIGRADEELFPSETVKITTTTNDEKMRW